MQIFNAEHLRSLADRQQIRPIDIEPRRGTIYDRLGRPLALNITVYSLYANPRSMTENEKDEVIKLLAPMLGLKESFVEKRLDRDKYFVWLARKISQDAYEKIKELNINGLGFRKESRRFYPNQYLAAHVLGFAGIDNRGLDGLEMKYDHFLRGKPGKAHIIRDARHRELLIEQDYVPVQHGFDVYLTIDETIQFLAERALDNAFKKYKAKSGSIVVLDPKTGEILALANRPTFNLEDLSTYTDDTKPNRAVIHTYEPGSVFKIVAAAAGLEEEAFVETDIIFCENGKYKVASHTLKDTHPYGELTFQEVIEKSSNIGTCKIAQKLGAKTMVDYARRFRFGDKTEVDMPGEVGGWVKNPREWSKLTITAFPMGHEVTVTPIQLAAAMATVANDGVYMKPYVVKSIRDYNDVVIESFQSTEIDRAITIETAQRLKAILEGVVENGTGTNAQIEGVRVAGKTGTAQKVVDGRYSNSKYYASFVGFAPVDDPQLVVVVVVNEPRPYYYGGTVSAPVFKEVVEKGLKYLKSRPNRDPALLEKEQHAITETVTTN